MINIGDRKSFEQSIHVVNNFGTVSVFWLLFLLMRTKHKAFGLVEKKPIQKQNTCHKTWSVWLTQDSKECEDINDDKFWWGKTIVQNMAPKNDNSFGKSCNFKVFHPVQTYSSLDIIT